MKLQRIITSTNNLPNYIQFWPSISQMWKNYGLNIICIFITDLNEDDELVKKVKKYGDIMLVKPIEGIPDGNLAKIYRILAASFYFKDEVCTLVDIDQYLLSNKWLEDCTKDVPDNFIVSPQGTNAYCRYGEKMKNKFPMSYVTAKGSTFHDIINPNNLSIDDLIKSFYKISDSIDGKESLSNNKKLKPPYGSGIKGECAGNFSDESLLRYLMNKWSDKDSRWIKNPPSNCERYFGKMYATKRIDRNDSTYDRKKLNNGEYVDCQPPRPFNDNIDYLKDILTYLNIGDNYIL